MTKNEIIKLYIGDLKSKVTETDARNNRIKMLESELETTKPVNVGLADISGSFCECIEPLVAPREHIEPLKCFKCKKEFNPK